MKFDMYYKRIKELDAIIASLEAKMPRFPDGNLRAVRDKKTIKYFLITQKGDTNGCYIKKSEIQIARQLAQRDYCKALLKEAKREKKAIEMFLRNMQGTAPEEVFKNLNEYRRALATPLLVSDDEYAEQWQNAPFKGNPFNPEDRIYETKRGEMVRSKSEEMLANMYYELGIPYRYEAPVVLNDGKVKYPDFTLLKMPERKEIYHEHLGLLEDDDYRRSNLIKIRDYEKAGICCCDNLLITYETDYAPLNIKIIAKQIKRIFLYHPTPPGSAGFTSRRTQNR